MWLLGGGCGTCFSSYFTRIKQNKKKTQSEEAEILTFLKLDTSLFFFRGKNMLNSIMPLWGGMTMSVSCNIFMIFIEGECKLLKRVFKEILWLQRILVSSAVSVKTHNTVFHIFTNLFARCTCQLLLCELCRWFVNSAFHYQFLVLLFLADCYRTLHPLIYRRKATHLLSIMSVPHDVSEYLNVFFPLSISIIFMENSHTCLPQLFFMLCFFGLDHLKMLIHVFCQVQNVI